MSKDDRLKLFVAREEINKTLKKADGLQKEAALKIKEKMLTKALNVVGPSLLKEGMSVPHVFEKYPHLEDKFKDGIRAKSLLFMVDLSPFSERVADWTPHEISLFLERYYRIVVSRVSDTGGVVEKYIGDAVIAAFGAPFDQDTTSNHLDHVIKLSRALIKEIESEFQGEVTGKCAIAFGSCHFGYVGPSVHSELTIIGNPLTELFRLESDCPMRSVILRKELFEHVKEEYPIIPAGTPEAAKPTLFTKGAGR